MKKPKLSDDQKTNQSKDAEGYPLYPDKDDIYRRANEEKDVDPFDLSKVRNTDEELDIEPDEDLELDEEILEEELDVPGSDLDDDEEDIGNEDEENNYYSIGGDNHEDLEEDNQTYDLEEDEES